MRGSEATRGGDEQARQRLQTLETAADLAAFRNATGAALAELVGKGGFEDFFAPATGEVGSREP